MHQLLDMLTQEHVKKNNLKTKRNAPLKFIEWLAKKLKLHDGQFYAPIIRRFIRAEASEMRKTVHFLFHHFLLI